MPSCLFLSSLEGTNLVRTGYSSPSFPQTVFLLCAISNKLARCRPCRQMRVTVRVCPDLSLGGFQGVTLSSLRFVISSILQHHVLLSLLCSRFLHDTVISCYSRCMDVEAACLLHVCDKHEGSHCTAASALSKHRGADTLFPNQGEMLLRPETPPVLLWYRVVGQQGSSLALWTVTAQICHELGNCKEAGSQLAAPWSGVCWKRGRPLVAKWISEGLETEPSWLSPKDRCCWGVLILAPVWWNLLRRGLVVLLSFLLAKLWFPPAQLMY